MIAPNCGVIYIAYGDSAAYYAKRSIDSLRRVHPDLPVSAIGSAVEGATGLLAYEPPRWQPAQRQLKARAAKFELFRMTPHDYTLYLDADTIPYHSLEVGFKMLQDGFDMVIVPSANQGKDIFWHIDKAERETTLNELGITPVQLQAGIFWFAKNERVGKFFAEWHNEWERFGQHDQAAFMRALQNVPLKLFLLGRQFNGGAAIAHQHGVIKADG